MPGPGVKPHERAFRHVLRKMRSRPPVWTDPSDLDQQVSSYRSIAHAVSIKARRIEENGVIYRRCIGREMNSMALPCMDAAFLSIDRDVNTRYASPFAIQAIGNPELELSGEDLDVAFEEWKIETQPEANSEYAP